ncbi:rhodanese-like domain-containing protein [Limnobacter humi]|uniref:Rhodanese-like domain-containing protein n=1 Tax=Limnobacter humi TaxID=1778671 RepID=A0ABT1WI04_9BURK|nr:rhodanese-like domain-containing protein [Limnobacter humi]MCQ8897145.1 rhodanese-like domain-containing protein [Limnobacter humi]
MNTTLHELLNRAKQRAQERDLPYLGALTPDESWQLLQTDDTAVLVDVRTHAEADWVGQVSLSYDRSCHVEWSTYPDGTRNPDFVAELKARVQPHQIVLFLCRSGVRSHHAAAAAAEQGYIHAINILEGFEGDKNEHHRRSTQNGWRFRGLPWEQH